MMLDSHKVSVQSMKGIISICKLCSGMYKIIASILHQIVLAYSSMKIHYIIDYT